jgi:hypothetical protein
VTNRLTVTLEQSEYSALLKVAVAELRNPSDQLRYILRRELERLGLIQAADSGGTAQAQKSEQEASSENR